jgi:hypothetical protein
MIKVNDRVRFIKPNEDEDPNDLYTVKEVNGDRSLIELRDKPDSVFTMKFYPMFVVKTEDLESV